MDAETMSAVAARCSLQGPEGVPEIRLAVVCSAELDPRAGAIIRWMSWKINKSIYLRL